MGHKTEPPLTTAICTECGSILTDEEARYYETRCERCEGEWFERIEAWRHGGEDAELDRLYAGPGRVVH